MAPYIPGSGDESMLDAWARNEGVDVFLSTYYSRCWSSPPAWHRKDENDHPKHVALMHDVTPERLHWDMTEVSKAVSLTH